MKYFGLVYPPSCTSLGPILQLCKVSLVSVCMLWRSWAYKTFGQTYWYCVLWAIRSIKTKTKPTCCIVWILQWQCQYESQIVYTGPQHPRRSSSPDTRALEHCAVSPLLHHSNSVPVMLWYLDKNQEEISDCKCNKELTSVFYNWITDKHKPIYNICIAWDQWPDSTQFIIWSAWIR